MPWGKVDDKLHSHPKVIRLASRQIDRLAAMGLWVLLLSHGSDHPRDGFVPRELVEHFAGGAGAADTLAARLVGVGLWEPREGGWVFHDWADYQPTRAELAEQRRQRVEAGRLGGQAKARGKTGAGPSEPLAGATPTPATVSSPVPIPSRPDPVPIPPEGDPPQAGTPVLEVQEPGKPTKRATRCPPSSDPGAMAWAQAHGIPPPEPGTEAAAFLDYWASVGGRNATSPNWRARWDSRPAWTRRDGAGAPKGGVAPARGLPVQKPGATRLWTTRAEREATNGTTAGTGSGNDAGGTAAEGTAVRGVR